MKKRMAVLSAFMIGVNCFASGTMVMAEQNEGEAVGLNHSDESHIPEGLFSDTENVFVKEPFELFKNEGIEFSNKAPALFDLSEEEKKDAITNGEGSKEEGLESKSSGENLSEDKEKEETKEEENKKPAEMDNLKIPQKFDVVIDPWEMDGKGQIYSEQYVIQNTGEKAGILSLSHLTCKPQGQNGVIVKTDKTGLHDNKEKSVYMEMVFGNGARIVLSEESSEYQAELQPGEELSLSFTGEINEYAEEGWKNGDVSIGVVYSWDIVETVTSETTEDMEKTADTNSMGKESESDMLDIPGNEPGNGEENLIGGEEETDGENQELEEGDSKEETKIIELQSPEALEIVIDSWEIDDDGQIASGQYVVRNTGDRAGIFELTKLICRPQEDGIIVKSKTEEMEEEKEKGIYMEMVLGNGEKLVLSQEEASYQVELKSGEEVSICFMGEMSQSTLESVKEKEIVVSASGSWKVLEIADE